MQENKSSNYDKLSEEWRLKFLEMDKELVKKKVLVKKQVFLVKKKVLVKKKYF